MLFDAWGYQPKTSAYTWCCRGGVRNGNIVGGDIVARIASSPAIRVISAILTATSAILTATVTATATPAVTASALASWARGVSLVAAHDGGSVRSPV